MFCLCLFKIKCAASFPIVFYTNNNSISRVQFHSIKIRMLEVESGRYKHTYRPPNVVHSTLLPRGYFLQHIGLPLSQNKNFALDSYGKMYDNIVLIGDNTTGQNEGLMEFLGHNELLNLVKFPTCYKIAENNPSTIYLIITNKHKCFQNTVDLSTAKNIFKSENYDKHWPERSIIKLNNIVFSCKMHFLKFT